MYPLWVRACPSVIRIKAYSHKADDSQFFFSSSFNFSENIHLLHCNFLKSHPGWLINVFHILKLKFCSLLFMHSFLKLSICYSITSIAKTSPCNNTTIPLLGFKVLFMVEGTSQLLDKLYCFYHCIECFKN